MMEKYTTIEKRQIKDERAGDEYKESRKNDCDESVVEGYRFKGTLKQRKLYGSVRKLQANMGTAAEVLTYGKPSWLDAVIRKLSWKEKVPGDWIKTAMV